MISEDYSREKVDIISIVFKVNIIMILIIYIYTYI